MAKNAKGDGSGFTPRLPTSARRVLVIEDNADAAESLRDALELDGHQVTVAYSGADGVEQARAHAPDLVLCDIGLPVMDGYGVARELRVDADAAVRSTFLVALSGYAQQEDVIRATNAGFDRHITKPPSIEILQNLMLEVLAKDKDR